jgi:DNA polymerase III delta prime subunit
MNNLDFNKMLDRTEICKNIKNILGDFEKNKTDLLFKRGIYIYGDPGSGKTTFVMNLLKELGYDVIKYDAGDIRNKSIIETITKHNMSDKNIMSMFHKNVKKIAIVMDEIDGMNSGDKGGITTLIKLIRPKKTKKQRQEVVTMNPIICIGNYHVDKKIKELMKVCNSIELKSPTQNQMYFIINKLYENVEEKNIAKMCEIIQGDLRKLTYLYQLYLKDKTIINKSYIYEILQKKSYNEDTKKLVKNLFNNNYNISDHCSIMNETDRTSVGLLWHENIIDLLEKDSVNISLPFYSKLLDNICFADYIDRITFQKQIWQFNEMSSLIKTFKNNKLYHEQFNKKTNYDPSEVRFTKVLTKYSTEFHNYGFVQMLCQKLGVDKKDLFEMFLNIKNKYSDTEIIGLFENYDISKLDINRIYRYLDKYTKENAKDLEDIVDIIDDDDCAGDCDYSSESD